MIGTVKERAIIHIQEVGGEPFSWFGTITKATGDDGYIRAFP
jgi:hypothetical protein